MRYELRFGGLLLAALVATACEPQPTHGSDHDTVSGNDLSMSSADLSVSSTDLSVSADLGMSSADLAGADMAGADLSTPPPDMTTATYCSCSLAEASLTDNGPTPGNYDGTLCQEEDCGGNCRPYCLDANKVCDDGTCVVSEKTMAADPSRVSYFGSPGCGLAGEPPCYLPGDSTDPSPGFFCLGIDETISSDAAGDISSFTCVYNRGWDYMNDQALPTDSSGNTLCNYNADCPSMSQVCVPYASNPPPGFTGVCTESQFLTPYVVAVGGACLYDTDCANSNGSGQVNACVNGVCTTLPL